MSDVVLPRTALVLGFRRTGQAVARALAARGARVTVADDRDAAALGIDAAAWPGVALQLGRPATLPADVELVVPSPGVPRTAPVLQAAVVRGVAVWSEIELAGRLLDCPLVAITGTNGKSTTTTVVGRALALAGRRTFTGGNLGTPLVEALDAAPEVAVAEVSSFQLEWVERFRPAVGALLNVTDDHLDRHASFAEYRGAKARLFAAQRPDDVAVLNADDPAVREVARGVPGRVLWFGVGERSEGAFPRGDDVVLRLPGVGEERVSRARTRLVGAHNVENLCAAVAIARAAGVPLAAVQEAVDTVEPLAHRLALVADRDGVRWFDDSKATNVGAAVKSLGSFEAPVVLLAGGVDKGGDYAPLAAAARGHVRRACCYGAARELIARALDAAGVPTDVVATLDAAVARAAAVARRGDVVLLAPACSSFDQFPDYAARGRAFRAAVEALA